MMQGFPQSIRFFARYLSVTVNVFVHPTILVIREELEPPGDVIEHGVVGVFVEVVNVEIRVPVHVIPCQAIS